MPTTPSGHATATRAPIRPGGPTPVALGIIGVSAALGLIAHTTASGWLIVVLSGMGGVLVVGAVWPILSLRRVCVDAVVPRDATVGRSLPISLTVRTPAPVSIAVAEFGQHRFAVMESQQGDAMVVPGRRGILGSLTVDVRGAAPLGLFRWRRRFLLELPRPVEIGPAPESVVAPWRANTSGADEDASVPGGSGGDLVRGVRDYQPGDPPKLVAWAASARTGTLMVRELECPRAPLVTVVVDLRGGFHEAEAAAARAAGLAGAALADGFDVELATAEVGGPRLGPVASPVEVGRRLARATPGPPAVPPPERWVLHVDCRSARQVPA